jgi:hypothetical protein
MKNHVLAWITLVCALLGGCAQLNWERGLYEGMRQGTKERARLPGGAAVPDPQLPDHDRYEQERRRLKPLLADEAA